MTLDTERLLLRPWVKEDVTALYSLAKDPHVGPPCGWMPHKDMVESSYVLENILMNDYTYVLVLKETGELVGNLSIIPYQESKYFQNEKQAELGFWMGYPYWGHGYMPEACKRMLRYGFEELGLEKIWCSHIIDNQNSKNVQVKCGFVYDHTDIAYFKTLNKNKELTVNYVEGYK